MKKIISFLIVILLTANTAISQNFVGATCSCAKPSTSTCNSVCTFSDCCICWNPNTQTGACGCYWGVATCRTENNPTNVSLTSSNFDDVHPDARIKFSFEKFNQLFDYFNSKAISHSLLKNVFTNVKTNYVLTGEKVLIQNQDYSKILKEYSTLIENLNDIQKNELNVFIKSIK